jgi:FkbM family methyltransferase
MDWSSPLRRWIENYYASNVLSAAAKPLERTCSVVARRLRTHIRKNGVRFPLPNGEVLRFGRDSGISLASALFWGGLDSFEPATCSTLRFFFSRVRWFVDVGANYGFYSLLAAHWNPRIQVVAFEPVPQIFDALKRNIELNAVENRVSAYPTALSDQNGTATLFVPVSQGLDYESTASLARGSWQERKGSPAISVPVVAFDDFERQHPLKVDLVKIDVEDHEASVLRGMQRTIRRDRPFIVCEVLPRAHRNEMTREMIEALGYTAYWITSAGYIRVSRFDFDRVASEDFLLSPVANPAEIVTDLEVLWAERELRSSRGDHAP